MKIQTKFGEVHVLENCPLIDSTERLEFLTEVHESFDGSEERQILRDAPRQVLNFNYTQIHKAMGDVFHMLYANLRKYWGIPLKQIQLEIPNLSNTDFIIVDTTKTSPDLHIGYAIIESNGSMQAVEITEIGRYIIIQEEIRDPETNEITQPLITEYQDGFRLSNNVTATDAIIMPLRICIIDADASLNIGGFWSNAAISFRVIAEDCPEFSAVEPTQYQGHDIYFMPLGSNDGSIEATLSQQQSIVDGDVGGFQQFTHHAKPRYIKPFKTLTKNLNEFLEYRKFLFRRMGRYQDFWLPLYEKQINVTNTETITNTINTDTSYFLEADRKHIAILVGDTWSAHEITSKTETSFVISPAINTLVKDIKIICYLGLHRFNSDQIEFQFLGNGVVNATVPIVELSS